MSSGFSYDRYDRRSAQRSNRTALGYWIPLVVTVTLAAGGIAAWVWSQRDEHEHESYTATSDDDDLSYGEESREKGKGRWPPGSDAPPPGYPAGDGWSQSQGVETRSFQERQHEDETLVGRVQGVIRRTPSPQQMLDIASKRAAAGMAAAGAAVGGVLGSIREEDNGHFEDHSRWSEEAEMRRRVEAQSAESQGAVERHADAFASSVRSASHSQQQHRQAGRKRTVAVVVSAEPNLDEEQEEEGNHISEQASILSHLPHLDPTSTTLLILIYAPFLAHQKSRPSSMGDVPPSLGSSYSALSTPAQTPGEEMQSLGAHTPALSAKDVEASQDLYDSVYGQARRLVERQSQMMPFATSSGFTHMLKHLAPDYVYVSESLSGGSGENITAVKGWVGQIVVVVGADGGALGGLVDTEDESYGREEKGEKWWQNAEMVGLGKGVEIVDSAKVGEDFDRRVGGRD